MSYEIFVIIGLVCFAIGVLIGVKLLKRKGIITKEDVLIIAKAFDLGLNIVKELRLENEQRIREIGDIVYDAIQYVIAVFDDKDFDELYGIALDTIVEKCAEFGIELNDNRFNIIDTLLEFGLKKVSEI